MSAPETLPTTWHGLTAADVEERREAGLVNTPPDRSTRSYGDIVRANVFTRFNAIISVLAAIVLTVGSPIDALFALVMVFNTVIGIVQEARAKRTLDRLQVLIAPKVVVVRDGADAEVAAADVVVDDLVRLLPGDQVPVDGRVLESAALEVDESALTGEADPVVKLAGDEVRSGSAVVAGSALIEATRVGDKAWIHGLVAQAKEFTLTSSELRRGVDQILRMVSFLLVPLGALLFWSQLRGDADVDEGLVAAVAGVVGLVPQGLVLLVSMALAVGIIRLARNHVVVQELYALEGLARVDVLCVDKTGTLTTGQFELDQIVELDTGPGAASLRHGLGALAAAEVSPTASSRVLAAELPAPAGWQPVERVAFSSARKWSGTTFADQGTWLLGAPEVLLDAAHAPADDPARRAVSALAAEAKRVLLVAVSDEQLSADAQLPSAITPRGLVVLAEQLRPDAAEIMAYFARQHVTVKVISGDSPDTVAAVGRRLGIPGAEQAVDMRTVAGAGADGGSDPDQLAAIVDDTTVFGRVLPEQKRALVDALQAAGHTVAMTGDGVNDIPALKRADIGVAMDTATSATKAVSQLVLLDGRFDRLPNVVGEGRRVIANMERVSSLFVTKTVYAALFAIVIGISGSAFPFLPRHMSLVSELTIGVPAFLLSFRAADRPTRPGYLGRVLRFALPAGFVAASVTLTVYWVVRTDAAGGATLAQARTASTIALTTVAFWILYRLMKPIDRYDLVLLVSLLGAFGVVLATPAIADFYALQWPDPVGVAVTAGITVGSIVVLDIGLRWLRPQQWRWLDRLVGTEETIEVSAEVTAATDAHEHAGANATTAGTTSTGATD